MICLDIKRIPNHRNAQVAISNVEQSDAVGHESLKPAISARFALGWQQSLLCVFFALFFVYLSYIPLFHSDIWGHVLYGQWILEHGAIPTTDPFLPLAEGVRVVDTGWLSQVIFGAFEQAGGVEALSVVFAVVVLCSYLIQTRVFYLFGKSIPIAMLGTGISLFVGFSRHAIIRPEIFGMLCLSLLLWILVRCEPWRTRARSFISPSSARAWPIWMWPAAGVLFAFWANVHGSFAVGLILLACHALGQAIEVAWRTSSFRAVLADRDVQRWAILTQLATAASLLNPYGIDLLLETATFGGNPNLRDVMEWFPLRLIDLEGLQICVVIVMLVAIMRHSRERVRATDVLLLLVFGFAMAPTIRMIAWFAPIFAFTMLPHVTDIYLQCRERFKRNAAPAAADEPARKPQFTLSLVSMLVIWCAFAFSPISQYVLGGKPRQREQIYSNDTPLALADYLRENPTDELIFAPQWWGEWLLWEAGHELPMFMTTNVHLAPSQVWRDYMRIARGSAGWEQALDRYRVKTLVVHKELQGELARRARRSPDWQIVYEDEDGFVAKRTEG